MSKKPTGKARSAISGRYVKPGYAKAHPRTTVVEHDKPKSGGKRRKQPQRSLAPNSIEMHGQSTRNLEPDIQVQASMNCWMQHNLNGILLQEPG